MMHSHSLVVSSAQDIGNSPYTIVNKLPRPYTAVKNRLGLRSLTIPYSWFNVTSAFGNLAGLSYTWADGVTYNVPFPPGNYNVEAINGYLQDQMRVNGHYLVNQEGDNVYYLSLNVNLLYYAVTLTSIPIPTSLPAGWSNPGVVLNGKAPQLVVQPAPNTFGKLIGYEAGSYPATLGTVKTSFNGQKPPQISGVVSVNVTCNWVYDSRFSSRPSLIASFTPDSDFGSTLSYEPSTLITLPVTDYQYSDIELSFYDQDFRPLQIHDREHILCNLLLEHPE